MTGNESARGLSALVETGLVNAPKQARSEQRLRQIVRALEQLLDGRSFDEITIPDIAREAECGVASIYARFKDKRSILIALHEKMLARSLLLADELTNPTHHTNFTLAQSIHWICERVVAYNFRYRNILRPAQQLDDPTMRQRYSTVIAHSSTRFAELLARQSEPLPCRDPEQRADLAVRTLFALLHQRLIFQFDAPGRFTKEGNEATARELAFVLTAICNIDR